MRGAWAAVHRPARLRAPAFALRAVFGELANEALLSSTRAVPRRLERRFPSFPDLDGALADLLSGPTLEAAAPGLARGRGD